jgi:hypothetical protein
MNEYVSIEKLNGGYLVTDIDNRTLATSLQKAMAIAKQSLTEINPTEELAAGGAPKEVLLG